MTEHDTSAYQCWDGASPRPFAADWSAQELLAINTGKSVQLWINHAGDWRGGV